ncbi:MAG TPA: Holliday junction resolvase RuvX [Bacillota bacterium]|nr:Holliday junction resolvase RuvX [Bacillota bacterium]HPF42922.1 Holliday junction resolvase RuvX [Bacillota bacterium]HPJ85515.1 Holliday junction resolvase RuvX [Bacillota bacterium]HPQ62394.1 Holliday junction resolvase RuvX [Bacillota bacterium]HRX91994.1 Holliday junction resolvase RuvX [Candidatus Izemoplasmatales bacterium]
MRYLGLDLGSKTLGIAMSDPSGIIANGITTFNFAEGNYGEAIEYTLQLIISHHIGTVVIGHPKNMDGTCGFQARISENFRDELARRTSVPAVLWDERLTTKIANQTLYDACAGRREKKSKVDQLAATVLLQSYLDSRK